MKEERNKSDLKVEEKLEELRKIDLEDPNNI